MIENFTNTHRIWYFTGKVYRGELRLNNTDSSTIPVAIKTLKENATIKTRQDFQREVELMTDLRHPNIVCLMGVVLKDEPMCMIFEHMSQVSGCTD